MSGSLCDGCERLSKECHEADRKLGVLRTTGCLEGWTGAPLEGTGLVEQDCSVSVRLRVR